MPTLRDVQIQRTTKIASKQDRRETFRAVLCDNEGNISGTGNVWANQNRRMVWYLPIAGGSPAQVRCVRLEPDLGLGVIIGSVEGSNELEVLSDDPFLRPTGTNGNSYLSVNGRDFEPGGRLQMWLYPEALVPLSVYPGTGLAINVVTGDYEDSTGTRQTFAGALEYDISGSQPAGPTEHLLVGIYINTTNAMATVDGTTVSTAATAPEPTWPAGATRLAVVDLNDTQTTLTLAADITNRRVLFPYPGVVDIINTTAEAAADDADSIIIYDATAGANRRQTRANFLSGVSGWPYTNILTVDSANAGADYATVTAAITGASAGDVILLNSETFTEAVTVSKAVTLVGHPDGTVITYGAGVTTLTISASGARLIGLTVNNTHNPGGGVDLTAIKINASLTGVVLQDVIADCTPAAANTTDTCAGLWTLSEIESYDGFYSATLGQTAMGIRVGSGSETIDPFIRGGRATGDQGNTGSFASYNNTGASNGVILDGVRLSGTNAGALDADITNAQGTVTLFGPILENDNISNSGTLVGRYTDGTNGDIVVLSGTSLRTDGIEETTAAAGVTVVDDLLATTRASSPVYDYTLFDAANASGVTSHFLDNDASYPAGWTETNAADNVNTNDIYSYWFLQGTNANTSWDYNIHTSYDLEGGAAGYQSFQFGPIIFRDGQYVGADVDYLLGIYRNNAGAIDTATYCRLHLHWDNATGVWQIQGEESDGSAPHTSGYTTLDVAPIHQPLFFRVAVSNVAAKTTRTYWSVLPYANSQTLLFEQAPTSAPTWGTPWVRFSQSRGGSGINDRIYIGSVDFLASTG